MQTDAIVTIYTCAHVTLYLVMGYLVELNSMLRLLCIHIHTLCVGMTFYLSDLSIDNTHAKSNYPPLSLLYFHA